VGQAWTGSVSTPRASVALRWQVAAVGESLNVSGQQVATDRVALTAGQMTGTLWLRQSDLATLKVAWDEAQDPAQPYPPGLVTAAPEPCAMRWPVADGSAWTSSCEVRSWMQQSPTVVSAGTQTMSWHAAVAGDGTLTLTGQGTLAPDGRMDAAQHFTQTLAFGGACEPLRWQRSDSQGGSETLGLGSC
jgi:hypothetical protein